MRIGTQAAVAFATVALAVSACGPAANAPASIAPSATVAAAPASYAKLKTMTMPKPTQSFDFAWLDEADHRYYLTDRTAAGLSIFDLNTETYLGSITGFVGTKEKSNLSGPNGLTYLPDLKQLWVSDGDSTVKVVDVASRSILATIATGGKTRGDDLAYDPDDKIVVVGNDADDPPFLTFISATDRKIIGKLTFPGAGGLETMLWEPTAKVFYQAVPSTKANPGGEIDLIDPKAMKVTKVFPLTDCFPHGIAFGPKPQLLAGCSGEAISSGGKAKSYIIDMMSGQVLATINEVGGSDIVTYNQGDGRYFLAASNMTSDGTKAGSPAAALGIVDAKTIRWLQSIPTVRSAHSVTADPKTNHVYVPIPGEGVNVYAGAPR